MSDDKATTLLYFIRQGEEGPIKVGRSVDPWSRRDELQTGNPDRLHVGGVAFGNPGFEADLHDSFGQYWIRGEWFQPAGELERLIEGIRVFGDDETSWQVHVEKFQDAVQASARSVHGTSHVSLPPGRSRGLAIFWAKYRCLQQSE